MRNFKLLIASVIFMFQLSNLKAQIDLPGDGDGGSDGIGIQICDASAVVIAGAQTGCRLLRDLTTSQIYDVCGSSVPNSLPLVLGDTVRYSYTADCGGLGSFCMQGTLIYLHCFVVVGSQNCPQPPTGLTATPNPVCTGDTLILSANGTNLSWTGPGGFTATGSVVTRIITSLSHAGVYSVTQTANNCTSAPATINVSVNQTPDAPTDITANPNPVCTGETLTLSALGSNLSWTGPDEYSASGSPVSRSISSVSQGGTYSVIQTVNDCPSEPSSINVSVTHTPAPTDVTASPNPICTEQTLTLTASGSGLSWSGPDNFSASGSPVSRYISSTSQGGIYYVTQTANNCVSEAASVSVTVNQTPDALPLISAAPNPVCAGSNLYLSTGLGIGPVTVIKYYGPHFWMAYGNPGASRLITDTSNAGIYSVTQTVNGCESDPTSIEVKVQVPPYIGGWIYSQPSICGGSDGSIALGNVKPNQFYGIRYRRDGGALIQGGNTSNSNGVLLLEGLRKGYYTDIQVGDTVCLSNILDGPFVLEDPTPPAAPSGILAEPNPVNTGGTLSLSASGVGLSWIGPDDFYESGSPVLRSISSKAQEGMYYVTQTVNNCTSQASSIFVSVQGGALPILLNDFTAHCSNDGVELNWSSLLEINNAYFGVFRSADMVEWTEVAHLSGSGNSSTKRFYHATDAKPLKDLAYYKLIQTDFDGSSQTFDAISLSCNNDETSMKEIQVYPNPSDGLFQLLIHSEEREVAATLVITDLSGRQLSSFNVILTSGLNQLSYALPDLLPGTYMLRIASAGRQSKAVKLMIR